MKCIAILLGLCAVAAAQMAPMHNVGVDNVITDSYLVGLKPGAAGLSMSTLNAGVQVLKVFEINAWRALHVNADSVALLALRKDPSVDYVEVDAWTAHYDCNDQDSGEAVWGLTRSSSRELPTYPGSQYFWLDEEDGTGVDAYIVDTGIYLEHNDFEGRARHGMTASGISGGDDDDNGHGTHCAGTVAGTRFGVAKNAALIAVKVLNAAGSGSASTIVEGVEWVAQQHQSAPNKKSVINMSLGISPPSETLEAAVNAAIAAGVNTCVSARNNNRDACVDSPSRLPAAITCAASAIDDTLPSFTNYGECVNIIAPGNAVLSCGIGSPDATSTKSGTSMSAPHTAGWVARYLSSFPEDVVPTPAEVMDALIETSTKDQVNLEAPKDTTPNRLMYAACD